MKLNGLRFLLGAVLAWIWIAPPSLAQAPCTITAPASVGVNQTFTLCGPTGSRYTYEWYGPGVEIDNETRCVTARVPNSGTFEYILVLKRDGVELDRCTRIVNAGGSTGGASSCAITGPGTIQAGETARLCAPNDGLHSYSWTGPNGFTGTGTCVTVDEEGTYYLTSRNRVTGSSRQCTHRLTVAGQTSADCDISGPTTIPQGTTARLCAPVRNNVSYRWSGPISFTSATRCITVDEPGTYSLTMRNLATGRTERCGRTLTLAGNDPGTGDDQDPDEVIWDNCPRDLQFWLRAFERRGGANDISQADLRAIARWADEHSVYWNWANDLDGMRQALNPARPLTRQKQVTRQYAALLANVAAGALGLQSGERIGLDLDTRVTFAGATTLRDLMDLTDSMLRTRRGNFARLNSTLTSINAGRGIGPVCE
jgi:hypothetical protein